MRLEKVVCALCGSVDQKFLYEIPDLMLKRMDVVATFVRCQKCGLIFQNPRPDSQEMEAHYPPNYNPYRQKISANAKGWRYWLNNHGQEKRCQTVLRYKSSGSLLDLGCANGLFLKTMQKYPGWQLTGLELNSEVARQAHQQTGLPVYAGDLESAQLPANSFDVVTLWDVFEHLARPVETLVELKRILKPDGCLFFRLPNGNSRDAAQFGPYWVGWESPRHLYVYTPQTASQLLAKQGFTILKMSSGIGDYPNFVLSIRLWLIARQVEPAWILSFLNALPVKALLTPYFSLRSMGTRGSSLLIAAQKKLETI